MKISLSKNSDVPLWQQLAEQIVVLIATGQLLAGQQLPSVRALARRVKVHHNTVSEAYQDLVRRNWLTRQHGSRLVVGTGPSSGQKSPSSLDELINESIQRAKQMGYSLRALTECVRNRLLAEPPDHFLVVEEEPELREIIRHEVQEKLAWPVESCTPEQFEKESALAVGAQVFAPSHTVERLKRFVPQNRPPVSITYSVADEHIDQMSLKPAQNRRKSANSRKRKSGYLTAGKGGEESSQAAERAGSVNFQPFVESNPSFLDEE